VKEKRLPVWKAFVLLLNRKGRRCCSLDGRVKPEQAEGQENQPEKSNHHIYDE